MHVRALKAVQPSTELDSDTLASAQRGEPGARLALVKRYERPVYALISRLLRSRPDAWEDLAQETFLRVFRQLPSFSASGPARLSTWILTISTRLALDALRKEQVRSGAAIGLDPPAFVEMAPPDLGAALRREIESLPPDFRAAFLLREAHGLSHEEIAQALDIDVGTARSRLSRARAALRKALEDHHG